MFKDVIINLNGERKPGASEQTRLRSFGQITDERFNNRDFHSEGGVSF